MVKKNRFDESFWELRYKTQQTAWDIGYISEPLKAYIDQLENKELRILIPGGGHNYEAEYLWKKGFKNTVLVDIAKTPLETFKKRNPYFPEDQILHSDFFNLESTFDLIIEHTFFCSLEPAIRPLYVEKMNHILSKNGKLIGLFFNFELTKEGPPFGGNLNIYESLFRKHFTIKILEAAFNSIKPRQNKELFFIFEKTS